MIDRPHIHGHSQAADIPVTGGGRPTQRTTDFHPSLSEGYMGQPVRTLPNSTRVMRKKSLHWRTDLRHYIANCRGKEYVSLPIMNMSHQSLE